MHKPFARRVAVNDVTERSWQLERGGQWVKGKSFPTSNPTGPWLVTPDDFDPTSLGIRLDVNGQNAQQGNAADMVLSPTHLIWYLSQFLTLEPGDLILAGTPAGVGYSTNTFLAIGDTLELEVDGLGRHQNHIVAPTDSGRAHRLWRGLGSPRLVIHRADDGQYYFVIKEGNAEVLLTSETYPRRASAENGIRTVRNISPTATAVDMA
jgi:uncharacterized protein YegP (UPF0339 family)